MDLGSFYALKNSIRSLSMSSDLDCEDGGGGFCLRHRNSPHVSRQEVWFTTGSYWAELDQYEPVAFFNSKRAVVILTAAPLIDQTRAFELAADNRHMAVVLAGVEQSTSLPHQWQAVHVPKEMIAPLLETATEFGIRLKPAEMPDILTVFVCVKTREAAEAIRRVHRCYDNLSQANEAVNSGLNAQEWLEQAERELEQAEAELSALRARVSHEI